MKTKFPEILIKLALIGFELLFVGILSYYRILNIGWMLALLGIFVFLWVVVHLVLMTAFIVTFKIRIADILVYLAVHFFYLFAWLFQADGADNGATIWTIQQIQPWPALDPFLKQYGENLFWTAFIGTFICYAIITVILVVKFIRRSQARKKSASLTPAPAAS